MTDPWDPMTSIAHQNVQAPRSVKDQYSPFQPIESIWKKTGTLPYDVLRRSDPAEASPLPLPLAGRAPCVHSPCTPGVRRRFPPIADDPQNRHFPGVPTGSVL